MNEERRAAPIGDWQLERYRLDELPADEREAVRRALEADLALRERLAEIERSDRETLQAYPARVMAAAIRERGRAEPPPRRRPFAWAGAVGAAVLAVALSVPLWNGSPALDDETRVKGPTTRLLVFRQGTAAPEPLSSGATVRARDVVQVAYQVTGKRYGAIVSVDGRGVITRHLPKAGAHAVELHPGRPVALPEAYELDDAPEYERFHLVSSTRPFGLDAVLPAARQARGEALDLPPSFEQATVVLKKETGR